VRLFLDTSVILAACGSGAGASYEVFRLGLLILKPGDFLKKERERGRIA